MATKRTTNRKRGRPKSDRPATQVAFRFDAELLARIDAYAERMGADRPGALSITRAEAVRELLHLGLDQVERR